MVDRWRHVFCVCLGDDDDDDDGEEVVLFDQQYKTN